MVLTRQAKQLYVPSEDGLSGTTGNGVGVHGRETSNNLHDILSNFLTTTSLPKTPQVTHSLQW